MRHDETERLENAVRGANPVPHTADVKDSDAAAAVTLLVQQWRGPAEPAPARPATRPNGRPPNRRRMAGVFAAGFAVTLTVLGVSGLVLSRDATPVAATPVQPASTLSPESTATVGAGSAVATGADRDAPIVVDDRPGAGAEDDGTADLVADSDEYRSDAPAPVEVVEYVAGEAGSVWIGFDGYVLSLDSVVVDEGWTVYRQDVSPDQVIFEFHDCDTKVEFKAQVDGYRVKLEVKSSPEHHGDYCYDDSVGSVEVVEYVAGEAGSVWIGFDGYVLSLDSVVVDEGWTVYRQDVSPDQVIFEFHDFDTKVEFKAQVDGYRVKLEVKSSPTS